MVGYLPITRFSLIACSLWSAFGGICFADSGLPKELAVKEGEQQTAPNPMAEPQKSEQYDSIKACLNESDVARGGFSSGITYEFDIKSGDSTKNFLVRGFGRFAEVHQKNELLSRRQAFLLRFNDAWILRGSSKVPVRMGRSERLSGNAAVGDIVATSFAEDYILPLDVKVDDISKEYSLSLKADPNGVAIYDAVKITVDPKMCLVRQAEFLASDGKPLKKAQYEYRSSAENSLGLKNFIAKLVFEQIGVDGQPNKAPTDVIFREPTPIKLTEYDFIADQVSRRVICEDKNFACFHTAQ